MKFEEYSTQAMTTMVQEHGLSEDMSPALLSQIFGLVGESGEVAEKFKKLIRDKQGDISPEDRDEVLKELGDVLWYVNSISTLLGSSLTEVAEGNLKKVLGRKDRGVTSGSGDNR